MLFRADVECVLCGSLIKFFGATVLYQDSQCAKHNKEQQFPGINVIINKDKTSNSFTSLKPNCSNIKHTPIPIRHHATDIVSASKHTQEYFLLNVCRRNKNISKKSLNNLDKEKLSIDKSGKNY